MKLAAFIQQIEGLVYLVENLERLLKKRGSSGNAELGPTRDRIA